MDEHLIIDGGDNYDEIVLKILKDTENKIKLIKVNEYNDGILKEINELSDKIIKLKEGLSNIYFQFLKHSSVILYEKKLKELIKEIESLKCTFIQHRNKIELGKFSYNYDNDFLLPECDSVNDEDDSKELIDNQIDITHYKLSFQNIKNERCVQYRKTVINCEVIILDVLSSVLIQKIKNCTIWVAAVESSLLIYNCVECNIITNSKQIRIHNTRETNFYINSMSSPVIENSKKLFFSPYNLNYDGLSELLKKININKNSSKWTEILDFNWQNTQVENN
ncbi:tubulin binding cofactor c [Plasmodium brasilianum]|uniref:Tubulin binding cofactor c n=1 Tax=Plasmodium brasilianum TaxID=5824 RepID=A0ACB9Y9W4_PLABR|nr:tubulin binding cofactor c [Plasmodium brasilianum]